jgi:hypothetical protein
LKEKEKASESQAEIFKEKEQKIRENLAEILVVHEEVQTKHRKLILIPEVCVATYDY